MVNRHDASSTPSKSQSQSQSQPRTQANQPVPPQTQSPPASPPRATGTGLVHQFSQLSTSDESHEHGQMLVPGSSNESESRMIQAGETQPTQLGEHVLGLMNQPSPVDSTPLQVDRSQPTQFNETLPTELNETQPTQIDELQLTHVSNYFIPARSSSPSLGDPPRHQSPTSSVSLGGKYSSGDRRSSPTPSARRSSPSLGGSPHRGFGDMNRSGGSSPPPLTSGLPTQEVPGSADTQESEHTAPTELVTPELQYVSATPVLSEPSTGDRVEERNAYEGAGGERSEIREGTPPTQIVNLELLRDIQMQDTNEQEVPPTPEPATPLRPVGLSNPRSLFPSLASYARSIPQPPTFGPSFAHPSSSSPAATFDSSLTTPLSHPHDAPHPLDRSRKSSFAPPVRRKPERQAPIPQLNVGRREVQLSQRWDASRAEQEERVSRSRRASASASPSRTPTRGQTPVGTRGMGGMAIGTHEILTASTPFVSGRRAGMRTPVAQRLVRSPLSPRRAGARHPEEEDNNLDDVGDSEPEDTSMEVVQQTEPEDAEPHPAEQGAGITRRESSLPLEMGRERRAKERAKAVASPQHDSEPEHESEDDAQPQVATPPRGRGRGKAPTARRGRGRGRGKGASITPRTPREPPAASVSPQRTVSTKKRPRATGRDASPATATKAMKKPRTSGGASARAGPSAAPTAAAEPSGTRVLAWWKSGGDYYFGSSTGRDPKSEGKYNVRFDDGHVASIALGKLRQGAALRIGDRVRVNQRTKGGHHGEGIVVDIKRWKTEHIAHIAMGPEGLGERLDIESMWLMVATPEVARSWGDRILDEQTLVPNVESRSAPGPSKRKAGTAAAASGRSAGTRFTGYAFVLTLKAEDIAEIEDKKPDVDAVKAELRTKIEGQGGVVADEWDELFTVRGTTDARGWYADEDESRRLAYVGGGKWPSVRKVFLLSGKMGTTPKYMMALALGVPCLSYRWIDEFVQDVSDRYMRLLDCH